MSKKNFQIILKNALLGIYKVFNVCKSHEKTSKLF